MGFYQVRFKELLIKGVIGFVFGLVFVFVLTGEGMQDPWVGVMLSLMFTGFPYGWELSGRVVRIQMGGTIFVILLVLFLRVVVTIYGGIFGYPIALVYNLVKMLQEKKCEG